MKGTYSDPTANTAIANIERERHRKERQQARMQQQPRAERCTPEADRRGESPKRRMAEA